MAFTRKPALRRLFLLCLCALAAVIAVVSIQISSRLQTNAALNRANLVQETSELSALMSNLSEECRKAVYGVPQAEAGVIRERISEAAEEVDESLAGLIGTYEKMGLGRHLGALREEREDIQESLRDYFETARTDQAHIESILLDLNMAEVLFLEVLRDANLAFGSSMERGRIYMNMALLFLLFIVFGLIFMGFIFISDTLNDLIGSYDLPKELRKIQDTYGFQRTMGTLADKGDSGAGEGRWDLMLGRVVHSHRTHTTFETLASHGDCQIPLWGKCYHWSGHLKAFQRLFWPAYGRSTWKALGAMEKAGIPCPRRVALHSIRKRRFTVGTILLTEHVGRVYSLRTFLQAQFMSAESGQREQFLQKLFEFWRSLHRCGIRSLKPRYIHAASENGEKGGGSPRFYLFDLDKVWLGRRKSAHLFARFQQRRDHARLLRWIGPFLSPQEMLQVRKSLEIE